MTTIASRLGAAAAPVGRRLAAGLARLLNALHDAWWRRRTARILEGLDDRVLRDIGVNRGDIGDVLRRIGRRD